MVREARREDAEAIARVHTHSWQKAYAHAFPAEALAAISVRRRAEQWADRLGSPRWARAGVFVAEVEGEVCGFATIGAEERDATIGQLYAIYVHPDRWGTGVGRALLAEAEGQLQARGFAEAILWVLDDNPRARRFYEIAGWAPDGGSKRETHLGTEVTEVRYRKLLSGHT